MSVSARDSTEYLAEFVAIGLGQIDSVSFGINVQQEDWNIVASEEGYDPIAATLAFATPGEPDFAGAICALDDVTGSGVSGEVIDNLLSFFVAHSCIFSVREKVWGLDDTVHFELQGKG